MCARWRRAASCRPGWAALRDRPATTADGVRISLMLNVGLSMELAQLDTTGAEASACTAPRSPCWRAAPIADVAEQAAIYARVLEPRPGRPVLFRTLDLGADKLLPGDAPEEENPAMGWRSLRIGLDRPALLRRQLRALLLAAGGRPLSVMFPMVATVAEFRAARALLLAEARRVRPAPERLSIGTMLEVPALMWQSTNCCARWISFRSARTICCSSCSRPIAARRRCPTATTCCRSPCCDLLEHLLVRRAAKGGAGVPVSLCGEAASRPLEAMALVGLGFTTLSMPASGILPDQGAVGGARSRRVPPGAGGDPSQCLGLGQPARADRGVGAGAGLSV